MMLLRDKVMRHIAKLRNHSFAIVLVKKPTYGHAYDEKGTVVGASVLISEFLGEDIMLAATDAEFFAQTQQGDVIRVYLVMVDEYGLPLLRGGMSVKDMSNAGVHVLQSFDVEIAD